MNKFKDMHRWMETAFSAQAIVIPFLVAASALPVRAAVSLPSVINSNMVIQRDRPATLWGWADAGEKVTVKLGHQVVAQTTGKGNGESWKIQIPAQKAGPIPDLTISGDSNSVTLTNVLAGEVWLCSGQSNMDMQVNRGPWKIRDADQEITQANHPQIRFYTEQRGIAAAPSSLTQGSWEVCSPETVGRASAVAYFFGREVQARLGVPVGLVISSYGGTSVERWMPKEAIQADPILVALLEKAQKAKAELAPLAAADSAAMQDWRGKVEQAKAANQPLPQRPAYKMTPSQQNCFTDSAQIASYSSFYNGRIHPLTPMTIAGALWYQGEANARRGEFYRQSLTKMIEAWRSAFGQQFPFLIVQLPGFSAPVVSNAFGTLPLVREAQEQVALTVPNCGIATAIDIGDAKNIHPINKQEVGRRLALVALKQVYGQKIIANGPRYAGARFENGKALVRFEAEGGLILKNNGGFQVAGEDRAFSPASAVVVGDTLEVSSPSVPKPVAVRYAFLNGPETSLFNGEGLPAFPFRSDDWAIPVPEASK